MHISSVIKISFCRISFSGHQNKFCACLDSIYGSRVIPVMCNNCSDISWHRLNLSQSKTNCPKNLNSDGLIVSEMGPWPECIFRSLLQFLVSFHFRQQHHNGSLQWRYISDTASPLTSRPILFSTAFSAWLRRNRQCSSLLSFTDDKPNVMKLSCAKYHAGEDKHSINENTFNGYLQWCTLMFSSWSPTFITDRGEHSHSIILPELVRSVLWMGGTNLQCIRLSITNVVRFILWIPQLRAHQGSGLRGSSGIIRGMGSANENRGCTVTTSLIGGAHTQNDPCSCELMVKWWSSKHRDTDYCDRISLIESRCRSFCAFELFDDITTTAYKQSLCAINRSLIGVNRY